MNRFSFYKRMFCLVLAVAMMLSMIVTTFATGNYEQYEIRAIVDGKEDTAGLTVLNFHGSAYISVDTAAELSGMEYSITPNGDYLFSKGLHHVTYDGQVQVVDGITYVRMQDAMDQLSCQYAYFPSLEAVVFDSTEDFVENLQSDCDTAFSRFDLGWVKDVPLAEETIRLYGFFSSGWNPKYFWGGDKIEQYENTLWGIMVPDDNESTLLDIADSGNKVAEMVSTIVKFGKEEIDIDLSEEPQLASLASADFMDTYKYLNDAIPGMDISSYIDLLEKAYGSQYASTLYINAVKYGLFDNAAINDTYLNAALQKAGKYFDDDTLLLQSFFEDWAINYAGNGIKELSKAALEESFSYSSFSVKIAKLFSDEIIGMKRDAGAVLALLNCAEIQEEAQKQYEKSLLLKESANTALTMKYSTILYLRACEYGYEKYKSTGEDGVYCYEIIQPLTSALIKLIAAYSDEELTREVKNENLDFSSKGFSLVSKGNSNDVTSSTIKSETTEAANSKTLECFATMSVEQVKDTLGNSYDYTEYEDGFLVVELIDDLILEVSSDEVMLYDIVNRGSKFKKYDTPVTVEGNLSMSMNMQEIISATKQLGYNSTVWQEGNGDDEYTTWCVSMTVRGHEISFYWFNFYYDWDLRRNVIIDGFDPYIANPVQIYYYK